MLSANTETSVKCVSRRTQASAVATEKPPMSSGKLATTRPRKNTISSTATSGSVMSSARARSASAASCAWCAPGMVPPSNVSSPGTRS
ncbi:MAG: hypothetical protein RLZZ450_4801 [Pseudomonadota bacterium]